jgi:hypothetical protein
MITMELEGVTDVRPADDEFEYLFNVRKGHSQLLVAGNRSDQSDEDEEDMVRFGSQSGSESESECLSLKLESQL